MGRMEMMGGWFVVVALCWLTMDGGDLEGELGR